MSRHPEAAREEPFGLKPVVAGITHPHVLQWLDPTFDEAEPTLDEWLEELRDEREAA